MAAQSLVQWAAMFEAYDDDEVALLIAHMRRTVELGAGQIARLRSGEFDPAQGAS
ncbi:hypothetical protein [Streptomyces sp. NBC_00842]|uniref:hypothetical protein n=1 Tax=unclassified Streptomyces TaxID=2593676 RepID=UPI00386D1B33